MSNFLSFIGGLASGAGGAYKQISAENQKRKELESRLQGDALLKSLESEDITPEERDVALRLYGKHIGMKPDMIEGLSKVSGHFRDLLSEKERKAALETEAIDTMDKTRLGVKGLPEVPKFEPKTMGELKGDRALKTKLKVDKAMGAQDLEQAGEEARQAGTIKLELGQKQAEADIAQAEKVLGRKLTTEEAQQYLKLAPRPQAVVGSGQQMSGKEFREGLLAAGINEYNGRPVTEIPDGGAYQGRFQGAKLVGGAQVLQKNTGNEYVQFGQGRYGKIIRDPQQNMVRIEAQPPGYLPPAGYLTNTTFGTSPMQVTHADGSTTYEYMSRSSSSGKDLGGLGTMDPAAAQQPGLQTPGAIPPPPGPPASMQAPLPQAPAIPPRQLVTPGRGPNSPGLQLRTTPKVSMVTGSKPLAQKDKEEYGANKVLMEQGANILSQLTPEIEANIGPGWGRLNETLVDYAGGLGTDAKTNKFILDLKEFMRSEAHKYAGMTVPSGEQKLYLSNLPKASDTPMQLVTKIKVLNGVLERANQERARMQSQEGRNLMTTGSITGGALPPPPSQTMPGQPVPKTFNPGDPVTDKNGRKGVVKSINPTTGKAVVAWEDQ